MKDPANRPTAQELLSHPFVATENKKAVRDLYRLVKADGKVSFFCKLSWSGVFHSTSSHCFLSHFSLFSSLSSVVETITELDPNTAQAVQQKHAEEMQAMSTGGRRESQLGFGFGDDESGSGTPKPQRAAPAAPAAPLAASGSASKLRAAPAPPVAANQPERDEATPEPQDERDRTPTPTPGEATPHASPTTRPKHEHSPTDMSRAGPIPSAGVLNPPTASRNPSQTSMSVSEASHAAGDDTDSPAPSSGDAADDSKYRTLTRTRKFVNEDGL